MSENFIPLFPFIGFAVFAAKRLLTYLHPLQQDDYDNRRFLRWIIRHKIIDTRMSAILLGTGILALLTPAFLAHTVTFAGFLILAVREPDPRKRSKKKLVLTARAKRIYFTAFSLSAALALPLIYAASPLWWILAVQLVPVILTAANLLLFPVESRIQKTYWTEAHEKLLRLDPKVIGITGSFGKTSVKHILGHILKAHAPGLITPGSVNTSMGITRIIREQLEERHKYFVVEMGAYGKGSIARLCRLTPPDTGIITAIGHAHYERFKTLDAVAETKFELAEAVLEKKGKVIVHERTLRFPYTAAMKEAQEAHFITCGEGESSTLQIKNIDQSTGGLCVNILWQGEPYTLKAPLYGLHHAQNITLAFAAAMSLGLAPETVVTALKTTPQITHRLEVKRRNDGTVLIDDAYNSNPKGFRTALDILKLLKPENGRAVLITPGMIELGKAHEEEHRKIGALAGEICDTALVIGPERIPSFIEGFKETGKDETLFEFPRFEEASQWLQENRRKDDIVLIENDLPDLFERLPKI